MSGMTKEEKQHFDNKLEDLNQKVSAVEKKQEAMRTELIDKQTPFNVMISEMHQAMMGYGEMPGMTKKIVKYECELEEHDDRIINLEHDHVSKKDYKEHDDRLVKLETNSIGKIETKKVIGMVIASLFGGGGILTLIVLFILNSLQAGVTP